MKLYASPMACSLASHLALVTSGQPHQLIWVDGNAKRTEDGRDYLKINPKGLVPALELDDGSVLTEGAAILQYIGDRAPSSKLVPAAGTPERYRQQEWLNYIATELHKAVFSPYFSAHKQKLLPPELVQQRALDVLREQLDFLAPRLEGRRYLQGEQFTAADAYMLVVLNWASHVKIGLERWPGIAAYYKGLNELPAVREVQHLERERYARGH